MLLIIMDERIINILKKKIDETKSGNAEIQKIIKSSSNLDKKSFSSGIIVGRLLNSFYYQHRRILKRDPTNDEFKEFIIFLKNSIEI